MELLKVIKFEGDDNTLVYKHPAEDFNTESQLIVHESQEAVLYRDGRALDLFGPGKHELTTQNIPLLRGLINLPTEGVSPFHVEVYFINKAISLNVKWGTSSRFQVLDPTFNIPLNVGASGSMEFVIENSRKFLIKVVGTQNYIDTDSIVFYFKERITSKIKNYLATIMSEVSYLNINQHLNEISEALQNQLNEDFDEYGIRLVNFYVSTIVIPEEDTRKVSEVLNKKMEYNELGFDWKEEQMIDISKRYASNPGSASGVGGTVAELPLALAFGEMIKNNLADDIKNTFNGNSKKEDEDNNNQDSLDNQNTIDNEDSDNGGTKENNDKTESSEDLENNETQDSNNNKSIAMNLGSNGTQSERPIKETPDKETIEDNNTTIDDNSIDTQQDTTTEETNNDTIKQDESTEEQNPEPIFCKKCGVKIRDHMRFCHNCGEPVEKPKCKECGCELEYGDNFCPYCGKKIEK